jgi:hypothetical protein
VLAQPPKLRSRAETLTHTSTVDVRKRTIARRTGMTVLLLPAILAFITLSTKYIAHSSALDAISGSSLNPPQDWALDGFHEPHLRRQNTAVASIATLSSANPVGSSVVFPSGSAAVSVSVTPTVTSTDVPTIPVVAPVLPTPFPQPFDSGLDATSNMSASCASFMTNMTSTLPFRQCRAFSFLSQVSAQFIQQAQTNASQLSIDVWGTCNTVTPADECSANMAWFASQLKSDCASDLASKNAQIVQSLASLQTYDLFRQAGCLADAGSGAYCYVEAAVSSNPSDLYLYSLPFGTPFPSSAKPSCSTCAKSIMSLFSSEATSVDGLVQTYNLAARAQNARCGGNYATVESSLPQASTSGGVESLHAHRAVLGTVALFFGALFWL